MRIGVRGHVQSHINDPSIGRKPQDINGEAHVLHPKCILAVLGEDEKHAFVRREARAAAQSLLPNTFTCRDGYMYSLAAELQGADGRDVCLRQLIKVPDREGGR